MGSEACVRSARQVYVPYYLRARYYDPTTGQFISKDPLTTRTRQPYSYVSDNPLNGVDPTGLIMLEAEDPIAPPYWDPYDGIQQYLTSQTGAITRNMAMAVAAGGGVLYMGLCGIASATGHYTGVWDPHRHTPSPVPSVPLYRGPYVAPQPSPTVRPTPIEEPPDIPEGSDELRTLLEALEDAE